MTAVLRLLLLAACLPLIAPADATPLNALQLTDMQTQLSVGVANDRFGSKIAFEGDTIAIAAPYYTEPGSFIVGAGFVSRRGPDGWSPLVKLVVGDPAENASFATSVALSGDTLVLGSYDRYEPGPSLGRADVFVRSGDNAWSLQASLAPPANATASFGVSVALQGDDLLVGDAGAELVTVYHRVNGAWNQTQQFGPPTPAPGSQFGLTMAMDGNLIAIGRPYFPSFELRKGSVLLYRRAAVGTPFALEYTYTMEGGGPHPELAATLESLDVEGDRVIAGAPNFDYSEGNFGPSASGAVVILEHVGGIWTPQLLVPSELTDTYYFGYAVELDGTRALIGAAASNRVYAFARGATQWVETQRVAGVGGSGEDFGNAIAISGNTVAIAAENYFAPGAVHFYSMSDLLVPDAGITLSRTRMPGCGVAPSVVAANWSSDGLYCQAIAQGAHTNTSWSNASCTLAPSACPDPLNFRVLQPTGSAQTTTFEVSSGNVRGGSVAVECVDAAAHSSRATALLTMVTADTGDCPIPPHQVSATLSPPVALPNGTFEMRAALTNPLAATLFAIARQGTHGTVHARVDGAELVLTYAPDYAQLGMQSSVSDSIGAAVSDGSHAIEQTYPITVQVRVFASVFE